MKGSAASAYVGRFAPSPTGPLHAGSAVAALASWLDAHAHGGRWLVRLEDVDSTRCRPAWADTILAQLQALGLHSDAGVLVQSTRHAAYQAALNRLAPAGLAYPCACSRADIARALAAQGVPSARHHAAVYPGTCRNGLAGRPARAWRLNLASCMIFCHSAHVEQGYSTTYFEAFLDQNGLHWHDRWLGPQVQDVPAEVGDFVLQRADGCWAYQLAVVVDDAHQGVTDVVRGADLADNTARQIVLQRALGLPTPRYLHTPLVCNAVGDKLSKQTGAPALDLGTPTAVARALDAAAAVLGLPARAVRLGPAPALTDWVAMWRQRWTVTSP